MELFLFCKTGLRAAIFATLCVIFTSGAAHAAESRTEGRTYTADLATMYNEYQRVLAVRDACITAQPAKRDEFAGAYQDWLNRHVRIVDDLDNRFAAIVKRASKDQADYSKNYGKYQSEVLQMREENKKALLANKEKLTQQCGEFVAYLRHPKSDIPALFPAEFKSVYRVR
jgi:hypothetical protein